jgi:signal transduction histidine kinase
MTAAPSTDAGGRLRAVGRAVVQLAGGLGTAAMALLTLVWVLVVLVLCGVGVGLLLVPSAVRAVRATADRERARLNEAGAQLVESPPLPHDVRLGAAVRDPSVRREVGWVAVHATWGLLLGLLGLCLPVFTVRDLTFPLWWWAVPESEASAALWFWVAGSWTEAFLVAASSLGWALLTVVLTPRLARWQADIGRTLLAPPPGTDLPLRVAVLTASRAAALDAHATELRRIERSLHDSTQNPLVGANVLIGAARRRLPDDPQGADDLLEQAQTAVEHALGELRATVRGILPPVLADRGLAGAIAGLAATSAVPTTVDVSTDVRCPASVEASAYFMVSEALTNVSRHSGARHASVTVGTHDGWLEVTVTDDGVGGADETGGSGLAGIRRRLDAHDGELTVTSPPGGPTTLKARLPCGS